MDQLAYVERVNGDMLTVKIKRTTACGENCASCKANCTLTDKTAFAVNTAGASQGDTVMLEMNTKKVLLASFMVYILPIIVFIAAYFVASSAGYSEGISALTGFICMAVVFAVDIIWDKKAGDKYKLEAVKIVGRAQKQ